MAKIQGIITVQKFEALATRIVNILFDELLQQYLYTYDTDIYATLQKIFLERSKPVQAEDCPCIVVNLAIGNFDNNDAISSDGTYRINIDAYAKAETVPPNRGDTLAALKLQKILGLIRAIIQNPAYDTLGFAAPFVCHRSISELLIAKPADDDNDNVTMGRLVVTVRVDESVWTETPLLADGYDTQVKIGDTEKGYIFSGDQIPTPPIDATIITAQNVVITS